MKPLDRIFAACRAGPRHILLSEGEDPRIQEAAARAVGEGLARITLLGDPGRIPAELVGWQANACNCAAPRE